MGKKDIEYFNHISLLSEITVPNEIDNEEDKEEEADCEKSPNLVEYLQNI